MTNFKIEKFDGPLDLLLKLIEQEEMDITEVSLAKITDQYVNYIKDFKEIRPEDMADFLVVAAKLLLIKSKALLPYLYPEEKKEIEEFENQLRMYKEFVEAAKRIESMLGKKKFMFAREFNRKSFFTSANIFSPPVKLKKENLEAVFNDIINKIKPWQELRELEEQELKYTVNIEEKIMLIQQMLINRIKTSFEKVLANAKNKTEIIVSFLAMLELIKQRNIMVVQDSLFGEIEINKI